MSRGYHRILFVVTALAPACTAPLILAEPRGGDLEAPFTDADYLASDGETDADGAEDAPEEYANIQELPDSEVGDGSNEEDVADASFGDSADAGG